jgi:hypothetical protein
VCHDHISAWAEGFVRREWRYNETPTFVDKEMGCWLVIRFFCYREPPLFRAASRSDWDPQYPFSQYVLLPGGIRFLSSSCAVGLGYFAGASGEYTFEGGTNV